ncbi:SPOR domain-containing protein [Rhodobacteraceae bacterium]|nr:SPOR domain-containing protein [Paracoccaceae bacterium]
MRTAVRTAALSTLCLLALAACEDGQVFPDLRNNALDGEVEGTDAVQQGPTSVLKDVERPDIFNITENALWDGRPSLGGVWVAHPDVTAPERVILTNPSNGNSIPGALFRRERDNPGPRIQVSSDAASALGLLAGQPTELNVLVVRQEEVIIEAEPRPISDEEQLSAEELAAAGVIDDSGAGDELVTEEAIEQPRRRNFFQRMFGRPATTTAAVVTIEGDPLELTGDATAPTVETTTLDPVATSAAAAISRAEASDKPVARPTQVATAPTAPAVKNPFVQIGLFTLEANADAAAANLRQSGIVPTVLVNDLNGALSWRIVAGPVTNADDQAALLARVKSLGYTDAFLSPK